MYYYALCTSYIQYSSTSYKYLVLVLGFSKVGCRGQTKPSTRDSYSFRRKPGKDRTKHQRHTIRSAQHPNLNELNNGTTQSHEFLSYGEIWETEKASKKERRNRRRRQCSPWCICSPSLTDWSLHVLVWL
jgi:hypothetical protein